MTSTPIIQRYPLVQLDLLNDTVSIPRSRNLTGHPEIDFGDQDSLADNFKMIDLDADLKSALLEKIGEFWNTDVDKLEAFSYYNDGAYLCQRRRQKYDFERESAYWIDYQFKGATSEQALQLALLIEASFAIQQKAKVERSYRKMEARLKEVNYFEAKYLKRIRERGLLLNSTDWRVLPDIQDSYTGEKDRWIAWRAKIRSIPVPDPAVYDGPLAFAKALYSMTYPLDPKNYRKLYPNDMLEDGVTPAPAFMDPDDENQWTKYDDDASSDFFNDRLISHLIMAKQRNNTKVRVRKEVLDVIKTFAIEDIYDEFDGSYFVEQLAGEE